LKSEKANSRQVFQSPRFNVSCGKQAREEALKKAKAAWQATKAKEESSAPPPQAEPGNFERLVPVSVSSAPKSYPSKPAAVSKPAVAATPAPAKLPPPLTTTRIASTLANVLFDSPGGSPPAALPFQPTSKSILVDKANKPISAKEAKKPDKQGPAVKAASTEKVAVPSKAKEEERKVSSGKLRFQAALAKVEGRVKA
jgi:hypothetical protein